MLNLLTNITLINKTLNKCQYVVGFVVLCGLLSIVYGQREPMYSQYMFNMLNVNPAYAGNRAVDNITLMYRHQWTGIEGAPRTATLSWDRRAENSNIGYGMQIFNDRLGLENTSTLRGFYSYRLPFQNSSLSFGLNAGVLNYRVDLTGTGMDLSDPLLNRKINTFSPVAGLGFIYESDRFYIGASLPDVLDTYVTEDDKIIQLSPKLHYFINGGVMFNLSENVMFKPSAMFKAVTGAPVQLDANLNLWFGNTIGVGFSYRTGDAILGLFEFQITDHLRLGYSYDHSISSLRNYNSGTHELMLRYEFSKSKTGKKILSPRYF